MDPPEQDDVRARHLRWCLRSAARIAAAPAAGAFDAIADDLRAALRWSGDRPELRAEARELALALAELTYARGRPSETQERYEEAAALADEPADAAAALHLAAAVAWGRHLGNEAIRLFRAAADAARRAGDPQRAALELLAAAELVTNAPGIMSELAPPGEARALLAQARTLAAGDPHVEAAVLTVTTAADESDPTYAGLAERAIELAHRVGDARLESHALDQLTAVRLICGDLDGAVVAVRRRLDLLADRAHDVEMAWEYSDTLHMAPMVHVASGDLEAARRYARERSELPFLREAEHLAIEWLLTVEAIAGHLDEAVGLAERFRRGWIEAGSPPLGGIAFAPAAAAMVHGIRGDEEARLEWLRIFTEMHRVVRPTRGRHTIYFPAFEGVTALHRGDVAAALSQVAGEPESFKPWHDSAWRPWYTAVWAEAGVLADLPTAVTGSTARGSWCGATRSPWPWSSAPSPSTTGTRRRCCPSPSPWTPRAAPTSGPALWSWPAVTPAWRGGSSWPRSGPPRWRSASDERRGSQARAVRCTGGDRVRHPRRERVQDVADVALVWAQTEDGIRGFVVTAIAYAQERQIFDKPLAGFQLTQAKIANMSLELGKGCCWRSTSVGSRTPARSTTARSASASSTTRARPSRSPGSAAPSSAPPGSRWSTRSCGTRTTSSRCSPTRAPRR